MSVSSLLSKDDTLVYRDKLSISTPQINFRIPLLYMPDDRAKIRMYVHALAIWQCHCYT